MAIPLIHASCACDRIQARVERSFVKRHRADPKKPPGRPERAPAHMNILLFKSEIGKTRLPVYDLPGQDHVYGCSVNRRGNAAVIGAAADSEKGTALGITHFRVQKGQIKNPPMDYVKVNKAAAKDGVITPAQTVEYRRAHPHLVKSDKGAGLFAVETDGATRVAVAGQALIQMKSKAKLPSDTNPTFVYGKPTRPSTPVAKLVSGVYASQPLDERRHKGTKADDRSRRKSPQVVARMIQPVRAARRKAIAEGRTASSFKMKRFAKIGPRVVTRRTKPLLTGDAGKPAASAAAVEDAKVADARESAKKAAATAFVANSTSKKDFPVPHQAAGPQAQSDDSADAQLAGKLGSALVEA